MPARVFHPGFMNAAGGLSTHHKIANKPGASIGHSRCIATQPCGSTQMRFG
jgi:hypothetical protein